MHINEYQTTISLYFWDFFLLLLHFTYKTFEITTTGGETSNGGSKYPKPGVTFHMFCVVGTLQRYKVYMRYGN